MYFNLVSASCMYSVVVSLSLKAAATTFLPPPVEEPTLTSKSIEPSLFI